MNDYVLGGEAVDLGPGDCRKDAFLGERKSKSRAFCAGIIVLATVPLGCYHNIDVPRCATLADCPSGSGYSACEDGYCFMAGQCAGVLPIAGDGCCAVTEGDRTADTDCLVADHLLGCQKIAGPVASGAGDLFVTCRSIDAAGSSEVVVRRIEADGTVAQPWVVGPATSLLPPIISRNAGVYAAFHGGVVRYDGSTGNVVRTILSDPPVGGLAAAAASDESHDVVAWPTASGKVVIYDENEGSSAVFSAPAETGGVWDAFAMTASVRDVPLRLRFYLLWKDGTLWSVEPVNNPMGPVASILLDKLPIAPPLGLDGRVYVVVEGGRLECLSERGAVFEQRWTVDLGGPISGGLLVDPTGSIVAVLQSGKVVVVREVGGSGSVVASGEMGGPIGDIYPFLGDAPRVAAVTADGRGLRSVLRQETDGVVTFQTGLSFDVPAQIAGAPLLAWGQLWLATGSGHLVAWKFPDQHPAGRFVRFGADLGGSGMTSVVTK